jgi:hypothetical protein
LKTLKMIGCAQVCGEDLDLACLSKETALSTELFTRRATVDPTDTRHAICGADAQWHGAFPKCIECDFAHNAEDFAAGRYGASLGSHHLLIAQPSNRAGSASFHDRCGAVCAFGIDDAPPIANAGWGECAPGGTLNADEQCEFQCNEGFVSYNSSQHTGRPRAECKVCACVTAHEPSGICEYATHPGRELFCRRANLFLACKARLPTCCRATAEACS